MQNPGAIVASLLVQEVEFLIGGVNGPSCLHSLALPSLRPTKEAFKLVSSKGIEACEVVFIDPKGHEARFRSPCLDSVV